MSRHNDTRTYPGERMVAPPGKRLSGPGTRRKNPAKYDAQGKPSAKEVNK